MKKINLILSAVAAVALLASCSNGSKDYKNVKNQSYRYAYTVTGSLTTTNKTGNSTAVATSKTVATIKNAVADCTYDEDALDTRNYDYYSISISGKADYVNTVTRAGATTADPSTKFTDDFGTFETDGEEVNVPGYDVAAGYYPIAILSGITDPAMLANIRPFSTDRNYDFENDSEHDASDYYWVNAIHEDPTTRWVETTVIEPVSIGISDFDGDYFISFDNEYIALPEDAFDGFIGDDEFTLTFSTTKDNRGYLNETAHTNAAGALDTTEIEYKLTFKLVEAE